MRLVYFIILGVAVGLYLLLRECTDRRKEKALDIEVVREAEEHLGMWASKSEKGLVLLRLHRNNNFTYKFVPYPGKDTVKTTGRYNIIEAGNGKSARYYPRVIAVDEKNDTLFNFFIAHITPYDTKVDKVDRMVLSPNGIYDTISYTFYRIKQ